MVKGTNRQVIVVRSPDPELFEQAIFLLRPDAQQTCNVTQDELLRQAQAAARGYSTAHIPVIDPTDTSMLRVSITSVEPIASSMRIWELLKIIVSV